MRWPLQPLQPFQQTQLQPPFGQSVDSLCHPWFTTTNVSYRFPIFETSATALCGITGTLLMGDCPIGTPFLVDLQPRLMTPQAIKSEIWPLDNYPHLVPIWLNQNKIYPEGSWFLCGHGDDANEQIQVPSFQWFDDVEVILIHLYISSGWWHTYPSENHRVRQLGLLFPTYGKS